MLYLLSQQITYNLNKLYKLKWINSKNLMPVYENQYSSNYLAYNKDSNQNCELKISEYWNIANYRFQQASVLTTGSNAAQEA